MASTRNKSENTRVRIIDAARKLFAERGYQQTTVIEIAQEARLSEAAMYEYFKGKEDLLLTVPDLWVTELLAEMDDQLFGVEGAFNKLKKYVWWTFRRIEQSPMNAKIVYLFLKTNRNFLETAVYQNVRSLYAKLVEIFEEGRGSGEMNPDLNPYAAQAIVVGMIDHMVTRWLLKDMSYSLFDNVEVTYGLLVNAFRHPSGADSSTTGCGDCAPGV
jgi:TetR/AcrR family fatty acid metabolism transcriptional regulator